MARDYAQRRKAFGKKIIDLPLHSQALARIDLNSKAAFLMAFEVMKAFFLLFYLMSFFIYRMFVFWEKLKRIKQLNRKNYCSVS